MERLRFEGNLKRLEVWIKADDEDYKQLLEFLKSKGVTWYNGEEIKPESEEKCFHYRLKNGKLARVSSMCWVIDKKNRFTTDIKGLRMVYDKVNQKTNL